MDPNAALVTIVRLSNKIQFAVGAGQEVSKDDATELAETINGLHSWICRGGSLPTSWERARTDCRH
jgi:hypothetical protein